MNPSVSDLGTTELYRSRNWLQVNYKSQSYLENCPIFWVVLEPDYDLVWLLFLQSISIEDYYSLTCFPLNDFDAGDGELIFLSFGADIVVNWLQ